MREIENFQKALLRLKQAVQVLESDNNMITDCIIYRFCCTCILMYEMLKKYMEHQGLDLEFADAKTVLKEAYANHLINNQEVWLNMMNDRNTTSHMYDKKIADRIVKSIITLYVKEFDELLNKINNE